MKRLAILALLFGTMGGVATSADARARNIQQARQAMSQQDIRKVLGRFALRDMKRGDATGYYITKVGHKSAVLHEFGNTSLTINGEPTESSERIFVKRGSKRRFTIKDRATESNDGFSTRL